MIKLCAQESAKLIEAAKKNLAVISACLSNSPTLIFSLINIQLIETYLFILMLELVGEEIARRARGCEGSEAEGGSP